MLAVVAVGTTLLASGSPAARGDAPEAGLVRLVAGWNDAADDGVLDAVGKVARRFDGRVDLVERVLDFAVVVVPGDRAHGALDALRDVAGVERAEPDRPLRLHYTPSDPFFTTAQWGPPAIGVPAAWDAGTGSHGVTVGIIDTGVERDHADLAANSCRDGLNYVDATQPPTDQYGHGTHVAGTVAAAIDNAVGVAGMANACLVSIKVIDGYGGGSTSTLAAGIRWAADNDVDVVNMSLGADTAVFTVEDAVAYAWQRGVLLVASAGNDSCEPVGFPAAHAEVIAVAALESSDRRAAYSNCGPEVEVAAPGSSIYSTYLGGGYAYMSGTSMASPHVAGVAALLWDHDPALTNAQVRCLLDDTADDLGAAGRDDSYGWGRVDADGALDRLGSGPVPSWPACDRVPDPGPGREVGSTYVAGNDVVVHCFSRVGGACFDLESGDRTVSIALDDLVVEPVAGSYRFRDGDGEDVGGGEFCGALDSVPIPDGATRLYVRAGGPLGAVLDCGSPARTATAGFVDVTFYE